MKKDFNISNCIIIKQMIFHKSNHYVKYNQYHWKDSFLLYHCFFYLFILHEFAKIDRTSSQEKKKRWIARRIDEFQVLDRKNEERSIVEWASIRLRRIRFVSFAFCQIYREFVGTNRRRWDNAFRNTHTFIRWKLFFILTRIFKDFEIYTNEIPMKRKFPLFSIP